MISLKINNVTITTCFLCLCLLSAIDTSAQNTWTLRYDTLKHMVATQPDKAIIFANKLLEDALLHHNDSIATKSKYQLGLAYYYDNKLLLAAKYLQEAVQSAYAATHDEFRENCWNNLGIVFDKQNRKTQAIEAFYKSIRIAESKGDSS